MRLIAVALASVVLVEPLHSVSAPQPKELSVKGTYVHPGTGRQFPRQVGDFGRTKVTQYGVDNITLGYNLESSGRLLAATVYLYPLRNISFSDELAAIEEAHANFELAFEQDMILEKGQRQLECRLAGLSYDDWFAHRHGPVSSYLLVCDDPPWRVKWRFTHLPTTDSEIAGIMKDLARVAYSSRLVDEGARRSDKLMERAWPAQP